MQVRRHCVDSGCILDRCDRFSALARSSSLPSSSQSAIVLAARGRCLLWSRSDAVTCRSVSTSPSMVTTSCLSSRRLANPARASVCRVKIRTNLLLLFVPSKSFASQGTRVRPASGRPSGLRLRPRGFARYPTFASYQGTFGAINTADRSETTQTTSNSFLCRIARVDRPRTTACTRAAAAAAAAPSRSATSARSAIILSRCLCLWLSTAFHRIL